MTKPTSSERSFGISVGTVCALLAGWGLWRGRVPIAEGLGLLALVLLVPALTRPSLLRVPNALWWRLAHGLGWVNGRVLLSVMFLLALTPMAVVLRRVGWDPLRLRRSPRGSGWAPYPEHLQNPNHYERLF